jgi:hypothetical protein
MLTREGDTPHRLKPSGFYTVAHADVFSPLRTSYTGMRRKPYACGGCHLRNYVGDAKFPTILVSDIASSDPITMPGEAASLVRTVEHTALRLALAPMPTFGAGLGRMPFLLQGHNHSQSLCLVGKQVPDTAI